MMLLITDPVAIDSVKWLVKHTSKRYCFKQLIELGQLICSAGLSSQYKPIRQGKELQKWIKKHPSWIYLYYHKLLQECYSQFVTAEALMKAVNIKNDLLNLVCKPGNSIEVKVSTAIFRYSKDYTDTIYPTNTELPIDIACQEYEAYISNYKLNNPFIRKEENKCQNIKQLQKSIEWA